MLWNKIWKLQEENRIKEFNNIIDNLIDNLNSLVHKGEKILLILLIFIVDNII